jgi:hypothetical protein
MNTENVNKESFNASFSILEKNAQMLRDSAAPDIDKLVDIVTESVEAYKVVFARLEAIDSSLKMVFGDLAEAG